MSAPAEGAGPSGAEASPHRYGPKWTVAVPGRSLRSRLRDFVVPFLAFGANRIVGYLPIRAVRILYYRWFLGWRIEPGATVNTSLKIFGGRGKVSIGRDSTIQIECLFAGVGMTELRIGANVAIAYRVTILLGGHDPQDPHFAGVVAPVVIEDFAFVGANVVIMPGVTIGRGAVVAAGAVVTKDVAPFTIVGGNPARPIGNRRTDLAYSTRSVWPLH
jgi:acetyltransferase-like isoleucine patch superfamily enzyme